VEQTHAPHLTDEQIASISLTGPSADGRMIRDEAGRELAYDVMGRLISVRGDGISGGSYSYDALNQLISQNVNDGKTHNLYYRAGELVNEVTI